MLLRHLLYRLLATRLRRRMKRLRRRHVDHGMVGTLRGSLAARRPRQHRRQHRRARAAGRIVMHRCQPRPIRAVRRRRTHRRQRRRTILQSVDGRRGGTPRAAMRRRGHRRQHRAAGVHTDRERRAPRPWPVAADRSVPGVVAGRRRMEDRIAICVERLRAFTSVAIGLPHEIVLASGGWAREEGEQTQLIECFSPPPSHKLRAS